MKILYLPLYRVAVSYLVSAGRRWSLLEQLLLIEVASNRRTVPELSKAANVPDRLIVEAMINLMRAGWVEVRSTEKGVYFAATPAGKRFAQEEDLPVSLQRDIRWQTLCMDRVTGAWFRAEDLAIVYERDLPSDAEVTEPLLHTYDTLEGNIRDLFYLNQDEALEPAPPQFKNPAKPFARIGVEFDRVTGGLPPSAPIRLKQMLVHHARGLPDTAEKSEFNAGTAKNTRTFDDVDANALTVGGPEHESLIKRVIDEAQSTVIIHSCFVSPETVLKLLPHLERAARRKVRIELLWGLHNDPEQDKPRKPITDTQKVLDRLPADVREKVQLSTQSSGSHAKVMIYDRRDTGSWEMILGSCNFLSSDFDWTEISIRVRSQRLISYVLNRLIRNQLPSSEGWSSMARRLNRCWSVIKQKTINQSESGTHELDLLMDDDHYACVTYARDVAKEEIIIGCDLFGSSAETSVLVPMEEAARQKCKVVLTYCRPSRFLQEEGRDPEPEKVRSRGMNIAVSDEFHGKFLCVDDDLIAVTSFNWMSTIVSASSVRGSELGVLIRGTGIAKILREKLVASGVAIGVR